MYGTSASFLKGMVVEITNPLTVNIYLSCGLFPDEKGVWAWPSSYRPIAIIPVFSKIIEKITYDQLIEHYDRYSLLSALLSTDFPELTGFSIVFCVDYLIEHPRLKSYFSIRFFCFVFS